MIVARLASLVFLALAAQVSAYSKDFASDIKREIPEKLGVDEDKNIHTEPIKEFDRVIYYFDLKNSIPFGERDVNTMKLKGCQVFIDMTNVNWDFIKADIKNILVNHIYPIKDLTKEANEGYQEVFGFPDSNVTGIIELKSHNTTVGEFAISPASLGEFCRCNSTLLLPGIASVEGYTSSFRFLMDRDAMKPLVDLHEKAIYLGVRSHEKCDQTLKLNNIIPNLSLFTHPQ